MRRAAAVFLSLLMLLLVPPLPQAAQQKAARPAAPQAKKVPAAAAKKAAAAPARTAGTAKRPVAAPAGPAAKAAPRRPAAKAKNVPKPDPAVIAAYAAMPVAERRALQSDLVWTGDYNGLVSDDFGERSIAAVKSYQGRSGADATGILTPEQRAALAAAAAAKQEASGWRVMDDPVTGARLAVPIRHAPQSSAANSGTRWSSARGEVQVETFRIADPGTTLAAVFEQQKKEPAGRQVDYSVLRESSFVVAGLQGLKRFYVRGHAKDGDVRGFTLMYDQAMQGIMDRVAVAMASRFEPFPRAPGAAPARRKVEYVTAIVVDHIGHAITDRQAADGCHVITLAGLGPAERIAEAGDVALLRVYGARNLTPVAFAGEGAMPAEVTLVGIADPQAQRGGAAATAAPARVGSITGARRPLDAAPPGFSGGAALDARGRLVGMALVNNAVVAGSAATGGQAQLVPLDEIRTLLDGRNIAPIAAGPSGIDAAKASVVRAICVRK